MRSFVRVADLHSFTRAADALGISRAVGARTWPSSNGTCVASCHRTTRRVGLTSDGAEYLARCSGSWPSSKPPTRPQAPRVCHRRGALRVDVRWCSAARC